MGKLSETADELVNKTITIHEASRIAEETVAGSVRNLIAGPARVVPSFGTIETEMQELSAYLQSFPKEDARKWAATLLMAHAQLALGNVDSIFGMVERVVNASKGVCPAQATNFAVATIDALLSGRAATFTWQLSSLQEQWLQDARKGFLNH